MIFKNGKRIDGCSDTVPIGSINPYIGAAAPFGYLLCQGQMVSKTLYPELYEICGEIFGPSTSTEFKLPDLRGVTIAGYKENDSTFGTLGAIIGGLTHVHTTGDWTLTIDQIPAHKHNFSVSVNNGGNHNHGGATGNGGNHNHGGATGGAGGHSHTTGTQEMSNKGAPSWSGLRPYGYSSAGDVQNGNAVGDHTHSIGNSGNHSHTIGDSGNHSHGVTKSMDNAGGSGAHNHGNTGSASNIQPTIVMNWIVKAIMLVPNQSIVVGTRDTSDSNVYSTKYINNNYYTKGEIGNLSKNVVLIAVTDTAPQNFNTGDKYFNTSTKKIYTAANNSWENPEDPSDNALYIVFDTQNMYAYDGDTLVSVGGGTEELADLIVVGDTPEETTKLIIEESDLDFQGGIEISDEYTTGDNVAYSADYINNLMPISGSNANGNYTKFPDGTMFCWGEYTDLIEITSGGTPIIQTLPVAFKDNTYSAVVSKRAGGNGYSYLEEVVSVIDANSFQVYFWNNQGSTCGVYGYYWQAMGKWK